MVAIFAISDLVLIASFQRAVMVVCFFSWKNENRMKKKKHAYVKYD